MKKQARNVRFGWKADIARLVDLWPSRSMKQNVDPSYWPEHLQSVFREVAEAMGGKRLHPDVLRRLPNEFGSILMGHAVKVEHRSGEAAKPKGNHYEISIDGPALAGLWKFRSGELEQLARSTLARSSVSPP